MQISNEQLVQILASTLSPQPEIRSSAERQLKEASKSAGHPLQVLQIVAGSTPSEAPVRQSAAIHFKNVVKKGWDTDEVNEGIVFAPDDRSTIKTHLVQLMCTVPHQIQAQISEAISLIAKVDYPEQWDNLLPELVRQFSATDQAVVNGVLKTADSIFKRFRDVGRSDGLYTVLKYTLDRIQAPLLVLFVETGKAVDAFANDKSQLEPRLESLRLICRIFYSLNYQDLPEYFEDHMAEWMEGFSKYLQYSNPLFVDDSEEIEPSPVDKLQAAIVDNLSLYADKDEEPFLPFLPQFTTLVWNLLLNVSVYPKHDTLATTSMRFLSHLVQKQMHRDIFKGEDTLRQVVSKIVITNLLFRESDEELFEDDPMDYILTEIEGSDSESRRRCSRDLLRAMCRQFEAETTKICSEYVASMLADFASDPNNKWTSKDAAIHLMFGISIRRESSLGVAEVNEAVNVMDFFNQFILPELQDKDNSVRPVVKATALKFVSTFRNQFSNEQLGALMPVLIHHLGSDRVVVHTFAAYVIERILTRKPKITSAELKPVLEPLFTALFLIVDNEALNENEYVMKCVMRTLSAANEDIFPVTHIVVEKLTSALGRVAKNPRNPQFNHFLFESIAVLIKSVCSKEPSATPNFEEMLFGPFQAILQSEIAEFTPYVFQILAQLLEYRQGGLGESYTGLFPPLLTPVLWERRGNVPALTRLIEAYLFKAANEIIGQYLMGILGVFQKLLSVPATEIHAFSLLSALTLYVPEQSLSQHMNTIFKLLLTRLQSAKNSKSGTRTVRLLSQYFALFVAKFGAQALFDELDKIQPGVALSLLGHVWLPSVKSDTPSVIDAKIHVIALTQLLCDTPMLFGNDEGKKLWGMILEALVVILSSPCWKKKEEADDQDYVEIGYDAAFSGLSFAKKIFVDPFPEVADAGQMFVQRLHGLLSSNTGQILPLIQEGLKSDPKLSVGLNSMFQNSGLTLN